jgi:hypothetical protein
MTHDTHLAEKYVTKITIEKIFFTKFKKTKKIASDQSSTANLVDTKNTNVLKLKSINKK